jgi:iron complex outermembrane receptor protein
MKSFSAGAVAFALALCAAPFSHAQNLNVTVPVGTGGSLTAPSLLSVDRAMRNIPGGADMVPAEDFKKSHAVSLKDVLKKTPGVLAQPRYGEETRLSIRGSGLSRSFHLRGIRLLQDGVPITFADGSGDFQEIDPLTIRHAEVYRGGNGLQFGAATLGGAVNLVTPTALDTGYNALLRMEGGSNSTARLHAQAAQVFEHGDMFAAATSAVSEGPRFHDEQNNRRLSGNAGLKLGDFAETRFYIA